MFNFWDGFPVAAERLLSACTPGREVVCGVGVVMEGRPLRMHESEWPNEKSHSRPTHFLNQQRGSETKNNKWTCSADVPCLKVNGALMETAETQSAKQRDGVRARTHTGTHTPTHPHTRMQNTGEVRKHTPTQNK